MSVPTIRPTLTSVLKLYDSLEQALAPSPSSKRCCDGSPYHYALSHLRIDPEHLVKGPSYWRNGWGTARRCSGCGKEDRILGLEWCGECLSSLQ